MSCVRWAIGARPPSETYSSGLHEPSRGTWVRLHVSQSLPRPCNPPAAPGAGAAVCTALTRLRAEPPQTQVLCCRFEQSGSSREAVVLSPPASAPMPLRRSLARHFLLRLPLLTGSTSTTASRAASLGLPLAALSRCTCSPHSCLPLSLLCCPPLHITADCRWPGRDGCASPEGALLPFSALRLANRSSAAAHGGGGGGGNVDSSRQPLQQKRRVCSRRCSTAAVQTPLGLHGQPSAQPGLMGCSMTARRRRISPAWMMGQAPAAAESARHGWQGSGPLQDACCMHIPAPPA